MKEPSITRGISVETSNDVIPAAYEIGYPAILKACPGAVSHKTEKGFVRVDNKTIGGLEGF